MCVEKIQSKSEKYNFLNSKFCIMLISLSLLPSRYLEGLIAADNSVLDQFSNFVTFRLKPSHCTHALTRHKYVNYSCCCFTFCIFFTYVATHDVVLSVEQNCYDQHFKLLTQFQSVGIIEHRKRKYYFVGLERIKQETLILLITFSFSAI